MLDERGYPRKEYSSLIHRQVAYRKIYLKNRDIYPLPFSQYIVHHKDGNKQNYDITNLELLTREEHNEIHGFSNEYKWNSEVNDLKFIWGEICWAILCISFAILFYILHDLVSSSISFLIGIAPILFFHGGSFIPRQIRKHRFKLICYYGSAFAMLIYGFSVTFFYTYFTLAHKFSKIHLLSEVLPFLILVSVGLGMLLLPIIIKKEKFNLSVLKDWRFYAKHKELVLLFIIILIIVEYFLYPPL